jgi:Uma2 family endonuclease
MADDARPKSAASIPQGEGDLLSCEEFAAMSARGAFEGLGRWELRGGRLHRMSPAFHPHGRAVMRLGSALEAALAAAQLNLTVSVETSIQFTNGFTPVADVVVAEGEFAGFVPGSAARLIIEVASTTLSDDLGDKANAYSACGLAEYLVADLNGQALHHFYDPAPEGFRRRSVLPFGAPLSLVTLPGVVVDTRRLV